MCVCVCVCVCVCMGGERKKICTHPPYSRAHSSEVGGGGEGQIWSLAVLTTLSILASKVHKLLNNKDTCMYHKVPYRTVYV